ncbi:MAG: RHS repeat-associated core domain-containing protein, partial [Marinicella sp.]
NNRLRSFEYDDFGNVITERLGSLISTYTYYSPTNFDPPYIKNRVKTMTNWRGFTTSYGYDLAGNKISEELDQVTQITDYDSMGLVKTFTDGRGLVSTFTYDTNGYPKSARNPAGDTQYTEYSARGQKLTEKDGNGYTTVYSYDTSDRVKSKTLNSRVWLYSYQNGGRTRIETNPNGHDTTYTYDTQGRLLTTTNAATDTMTYVYDNNGNKTSMTDFGGHATTYSYDDANRLTVKTELMGKVTTYDYDNVGNVLKETTADRVTDYTYDPNRYFQTSITRKSATGDAAIVRTVDGMGNVLTETDPNQHQTIFTYDAFDRVLTANGPMGSGFIRSYDNNGNVKSEEILNSTGNQVTTHIYDTANRLKTSHLAEGGIITYSYDGVGNIIGETRPNGYDASYEYNEINLPIRKTINSQTWSYSYDNAGNLKTENWPSIDDVGNVITYDYDELNREISRSDTVGQISLSGYDADSNLTSSTDANGHLSTFEYNDLHQRIVELKPLGRGHTYSYTVFGELLTDTGPNGTITHTVDQLGRRTSSSGPDQYNMIYGYDANGNLTSQIDSRSITTTYGVNALNQVESVTTGSFIMGMTYDTVGNQLTETDYRGIASVFTYDKENRRETFTKAGLLQSTTTYNLAGLPVIESDARGKNTIHEYNSQYHKTRTLLPESQIIAFTPNTFGDVTFQNNPGPNDITRTYDLRRRLKTETNGANETTTYEYDLNNNRTAVIKPGGQRWEYDFDAANRLTHVRNVPESIETIYSYDAADNLRTITDAKQRVTTFTYDNRNRKRSKIYPGGGSTVTYTYDGNNNLKTVDYPNGVNVTYAYDDLNRQTNQSHTGAYGAADITFTLDGNGNVELVNETVLGTSYQTTMTYDDLNRQKSKTDRYGNSFLYTYDANGNRKLFRDHENKVTEYFYDGLNRIEQLTRAGLGTFDWSYNTSGLPRRIEYPNGSEASYSYDSANRIALIENKQSGVIVTSHDYEYDLNGNRDRLTESNIDTSQVTTYEYDDADRLTKVLYPTTINSYTLDKVGNRELELIDDGGVLTTRTYGYNSRDQLTSVTDTDGLNITYDYDEFGNQIEKIDAGIVTTFDYTPRQRVKNITIGAGLPIEYQYDYAGQRVNSQANGMEKRHLYDGLTLIADTNAIGNTLATYHYGVRRQLAETRNGQNAYYLADALGTNVAITNQDGSIQNRMDYDVWGNLNQESATSDSPFGFTGYIKDDDTELYYANARYYDSFTGRFLREDPFEGNQNMPPTLHRYLYANGNPTVYIDPTGKVSKFNEWIEFLNEPVQIMNDEIANEDTSSLGVIGLTLSSLPNEAASGGVSILNTFANALIVDAENKLKSIHPYANLSNIIGEDTRQIRNEHEAFKNSVSNLGEVIAEENIDLIRQGFEKFGTTLGHMAAGDNNALSSITNGVAGVLTGSYLTKTKFKGPDLDAKLEVGDAYKD